MDYVTLCTDAPRSFALGTGLGILAVACGKCSIVVNTADPKLDATVPLRLWQALIGNSGQRKSKVMDLGVGLLQRTGEQFLLPDDASVEAWHDTFAEQPISLMHQEELSTLLDAQSRSYSNGLQGWMLKLWSGTPKDRKTKAGGTVAIERPRLNILGAIPPDVFFRKTKALDWRSGFLPRFLYWGGVREEWAPVGLCAPLIEKALSEQLRCVYFKSEGTIVIPAQVTVSLFKWFFDEVESKSSHYLEDTFAGLLRLQEIGYVIAALIALSRITRPVSAKAAQRLVVNQADMDATVNILRLCKRTIESISSRANQDVTAVNEESIIQYVSSQSQGVTIENVVNTLRMSYRQARAHLNDLALNQRVTVSSAPSQGRGRPKSLYKIA